MTTPTQGEHAQTAAQVQRYKIGYPTDSWGERSSTPSGIPDHAGAWVRYEDHAAQVAALTATPAQPAAPQCVAYAELPKITAEDRLFLHDNPNTDDIVKWVQDYARACIDAERTSHGQAPAGAGMGHTDGGRNMFYEGRFDGETQREQQARLRWANDMRAAFERHTGNGWFDKDWRAETGLWSAAWHACLAAQPTPTAQAAPAAGSVAGPSVRKVFLVATGEEHEGEATYTRYDDDPPPLCDSECLYTAAPTPAAQAADSVLEDAARWFSERDNVLHSFWVLLGEAETQADNDNNPLLKHQVEGFYRQWNALNGSALEPRWVTRAARKQGAKHD